ncbi:MAG: N-acylneuraminate cytidylyltransferase [Myxococcales bacterium FL481]|nr:MAG: N-acylneuraminate cytidylyltransferase [Myxococcales bacterium FL481]
MPNVKTVAIIPARGGSKGIVRKNLQRVGGRSLVARSIDHARACPEIDAVYVSTDDEEIAAASRAAGAQVVVRPAELAGDEASTESALIHVIDGLEADGWRPQTVVLLQCTSPFREPGQLDAALAHFRGSGCDSLLSVTRFRHFVWTTDSRGAGYRPLTYDPQRRPRRQQIERTYCETGSFYIFRREVLAQTGSRLGGRIEVFEVPADDALEIDEPRDLERARSLVWGRPPQLDPELSLADWLVLDVDGTLTDGAMHYSETGEVSKRFDTRDGFGLRLWQEAGGKVAWISGEASQASARRAHKLGVDYVALGVADKAAELEKLRREHGVSRPQLVFMGDDLNDLVVRDRVALFVAPANARPGVLAQADLVTTAGGGHGAVRELVDWLLPWRRQATAPIRAA